MEGGVRRKEEGVAVGAAALRPVGRGPKAVAPPFQQRLERRWLPWSPVGAWSGRITGTVTAWSWVKPWLWVCARCGVAFLTAELSPRCSRCGFREEG